MMRRIALLLAFAAPLLAEEDYGRTYRIKVMVGGEPRKAGMFIPKAVKKNEILPLLVAIPDTKGKAFLEIGPWQQMAYERRFAVFSVDTKTGGSQGWHPSEQLEMQRDMEAVIEGLKIGEQKAREGGVIIDTSARVITGHSGGTYLTIWLGLRRPDLFLGICGRSCVFHKDTVEFGKFDRVKPNLNMPILLYRGELDHPLTKKQTELAKKTLDAAGYKNVQFRIIPKMIHESKPEVCMEWFLTLLKTTEKSRKETRKIAEELKRLRPLVEAGKSGVYGKLSKLVERETKAGVDGGAATLLSQVLVAARKEWERAENLEAEYLLLEAADVYRRIQKKYNPLDISKKARTKRAKLIKSDEYKARELLAKARAYLEKDKTDKAHDLLDKIVTKYPKTVAAEKAQAMLESG
jgi:predicted esterase